MLLAKVDIFQTAPSSLPMISLLAILLLCITAWFAIKQISSTQDWVYPRQLSLTSLQSTLNRQSCISRASSSPFLSSPPPPSWRTVNSTELASTRALSPSAARSPEISSLPRTAPLVSSIHSPCPLWQSRTRLASVMYIDSRHVSFLIIGLSITPYLPLTNVTDDPHVLTVDIETCSKRHQLCASFPRFLPGGGLDCSVLRDGAGWYRRRLCACS